MDYLGYIISPGPQKASWQTIDGFRSLHPSYNFSELRSFHGLRNVLQWFVTNFASISAHLNRNIGKGWIHVFTELSYDYPHSLHALEKRLTPAPGPVIPQSPCNYTVSTGTHSFQAGCVLLQGQTDARDKPVGHWSKANKRGTHVFFYSLKQSRLFLGHTES